MCVRPSRWFVPKGCLLLILLVGCIGSVRAQPVLRLASQKVLLGAAFDGNWRTSTLSRSFAQNNFREWLVLPVYGVLIDPGIFRYTLELRPTFTQQNTSDIPNPLLSRNLGFSGDATLLSAKPVSLNARWGRTQGARSGGFGIQGEFTSSDLSSTLFFRNTLLPLSATYSWHTGRNVTQVGPQLTPVTQSSRARTIRVAARNRKLDAVFDRTVFDDRLDGNTFVAQSLHVSHWLRWGKRSELASKYLKTERQGSFPYTRSSWTEQLRLQHTQATYTLLHFRRYRSDGLGGVARGQTYGWSISSRATQSVNFGARASASASRFDGGRQRALSAGPWMGFRIALPLKTSFSGGGSLGYLRRDQENLENRFVQVLAEAHTVDQTLIVILNQLRIDRSSILLQSADETLVFVEGFDYELLTAGNLTEIQLLPGSRITPGATILVSYRYQPFLDTQEEGSVWSFNLGLRVAGFVLRHTRSRRTTSMSGEDTLPLPGDFENRSTIISTNRRTPLGRFSLHLSRRYRATVSFRYQTDEARLSMNLPLSRTFRLALDAVGRRVSEGNDRVEILSIGPSLSWALTRNLYLRGNANLQHWKQQFNGEERAFVTTSTRLFTAYASLDYRIGRTETKVRYEFDERTAPFETSGNRLSLFLIRRF